MKDLVLGTGDNNDRPSINRAETIQGITITFLILAILGLSGRLYVRARAKLLSWDDAFIVLAMISMTVASIIVCLMPSFGLGKHFGTLSEYERMEYFKHIWSSNILYVTSTTFIKIAILLQYLRLFDMQSSRLARNSAFVLLACVSAWGIGFFFLALLSCRPIAKNWNFNIPGTCVAWGSKDPDIFFKSWAAHSATNMLLDLLVFLLPAPFLKGLRMGGKSRKGLMALFCMGAVVVTLSIARLVSLCIKRAGTTPVFDPSFNTPRVYVFSILEINIAILTASIPIFWPVVVNSFAANKILVVNEIEIRTDRRGSAGNALETGGLGGNVNVGMGMPCPGLEMDTPGRTSRMSVSAVGNSASEKSGITATSRPKGNTHTRLNRSPSSKFTSTTRSSSRHAHGHRPKTSSSSLSSSVKSVPIELGRRISQESQRGLNPTRMHHQPSSNTLALQDSPELGRHAGDTSYGSNGTNNYFPNGERAMSPYDPVWGKMP